MKLGKETGSMTNYLMANAVKGQPEPVVGMGVTMLSWSDRHAGTIIAVEKGIITVQRDKVTRSDANGMSENQDYTYEADPSGSVSNYRQDKHGRWVEARINEPTGRWIKAGGNLRLGERDEYYDYSF